MPRGRYEFFKCVCVGVCVCARAHTRAQDTNRFDTVNSGHLGQVGRVLHTRKCETNVEGVTDVDLKVQGMFFP
jgi:hypothetical protein